MKKRYGVASLMTAMGLYASLGFSVPTEKYKTHLDLLQKEKKILKGEAYYYTFAPWPLPVISNIASGSKAWNKYHKCNKMYLWFKSARIMVLSESGEKTYKKSVRKKAYNRLVELLEKTREESLKASVEKSGLVGRSEAQKNLDERIGKMTIRELAGILYRADLSIPPSCGNPWSGVPEIRGYNLRYQLRTASLYHSGKSELEHQIEVEEEKMLKMVNEEALAVKHLDRETACISESDLSSSSSAH